MTRRRVVFDRVAFGDQELIDALLRRAIAAARQAAPTIANSGSSPAVLGRFFSPVTPFVVLSVGVPFRWTSVLVWDPFWMSWSEVFSSPVIAFLAPLPTSSAPCLVFP